MTEINLLNLNIKIPDSKIGLSISGGADSAILCYILMKYSTNHLHFFTTASLNKSNITVKHSSAVIERCIKLTNRSNVSHHIEYVQSMERENFFKSLVDKVNAGIVDVIYTGTTNIPNSIELQNFSKKLSPDIINRRNPAIVKSPYSHDNKIYHPFINIDKKTIKELYAHFNLLEDLFLLTRSCESMSIFDRHCNECWWCEERQWAFEALKP